MVVARLLTLSLMMIAFNDAKSQLDKVTESKMGAFTKGMPGLF